MSVLCGLCKHYHANIDEVRACFAGVHAPSVPTPPTTPQPVAPQPRMPAWAMDPATPKQLDYLRSLLDEKDWGCAELPDGVSETCMNVCDDKTIGKKEASDAIEALRKIPRKMPEGGDPSVSYESVPEGRYALIEEDGTVAFYKVDRPTEGKWSGRIFVKLITGGVGRWQEHRRKVADILPRIEKMGARESAALFGLKVRHCGRCMSPLSKLQSRAAGYGEHCAGLLGWPYPSEAEARDILRERGEDPDNDDPLAPWGPEAPGGNAIGYDGDEPWWDHGNQS